MAGLTEAPPARDHVPASLISDVDIYNLVEPGEDSQHAWWRLRHAMPPIFWTPRNGGHWIATSGEDIAVIQRDHEHFSHREILLPKGQVFFRSMITMDPPEHGAFRRLITPAFLPRAVEILEARAREVAVEQIARLQPQGACEFVADFAKVLPLVVFLGMCDLPQSDREMLFPWAEDMSRAPALETRAAAQQNMALYLQSWIDSRRTAPGADLISTVAKGTIQDRPITQDEAMAACSLLLFAGLDTIASLLGFIAYFLAQNPAHRRRLIEDPAIIPKAIEELVRRFGIANTAREVTGDMEFRGVSLRRGEMIQIPNCLAGLDTRGIKNPLDVDFDRGAMASHAAFGAGPHTCPGATLARREVRVFLQEWLSRIPEFEVQPGTTPQFATGMLNSVTELRLVWK